MATSQAHYTPSPTLARFHMSNAFVRGVRGPVGSGKSTGVCHELMSRSHAQRRAPDGYRRTRHAVIRNTYRELEDTTVRTWLDWFPENKNGRLWQSDMRYIWECDKLKVHAEFLFRALDKPKDVAKVLSLELTDAWINEAREVPKGVVDALGDRVGRYPSQRDNGCTYRGIVMDTNSPDDDHWWYRLAEEERPDNWDFFAQPGGLIDAGGTWVENPAAENIGNLEPHYYTTRMGGKKQDHIRVYYANLYGFVLEGKPVYPDYNDATHAATDILEPIPGRTIYIGIDFGLTPAACLGQRDVSGRWRMIDEVVTEDMGAVRFGEVLGRKLREEYAGYEFDIYGDPAGDDRAQTDETTPFQILQAAGIPTKAAPSNDPVLRQEAVSTALRRMVDGRPGLMVSPRCKVLRKGLAGGYAFKRIQVSGDERFHDKPDKNRFSHVCDAQQYMMLGAGEGDAVLKVKGVGGRQQRSAAWVV